MGIWEKTNEYSTTILLWGFGFEWMRGSVFVGGEEEKQLDSRHISASQCTVTTPFHTNDNREWMNESMQQQYIE